MAFNIKSKTGRVALPSRREPYWSRIKTGLYVGYRKLKEGEGTWIVRSQNEGSNKKQYHALGTYLEDGTRDKAFDNAYKDAIAWAEAIEHGVTSKNVTVSDACKAYITHLNTHKSKASAKDAEGRFDRLVYDKPIGKVSLLKLKTADVKAWLNKQIADDDDDDEDDIRRSKDTANRNLASLKAALNLALQDRLVATDAGWKTVASFPGVGRRRTAYLDMAQRQALIKACPDDLAALAKSMLLTGARPGELAKLTVADFNKAHGTIEFNRHDFGKTGHRIATLSTAALQFFTEQAKGKLPTAPLLSREFGDHWNKDAWKKLFKDAVKAAKLPSTVVMYTLRHVAISELIMGGMDSVFVAKLSGTSVAMIEKHYGHLRHKETRQKLDAVKMI